MDQFMFVWQEKGHVNRNNCESEVKAKWTKNRNTSDVGAMARWTSSRFAWQKKGMEN